MSRVNCFSFVRFEMRKKIVWNFYSCFRLYSFEDSLELIDSRNRTMDKGIKTKLATPPGAVPVVSIGFKTLNIKRIKYSKKINMYINGIKDLYLQLTII